MSGRSIQAIGSGLIFAGALAVVLASMTLDWAGERSAVIVAIAVSCIAAFVLAQRYREGRSAATPFEVTPQMLAKLLAELPKRPIFLTVVGNEHDWATGQRLFRDLRRHGFEVHIERWPESRFAMDDGCALQWRDQFRDIAMCLEPKRAL